MIKAKPFVKWAGGKRQILDKLKSDEKSIAFTLEFLDLTKTLTEEEVSDMFEKGREQQNQIKQEQEANAQ